MPHTTAAAMRPLPIFMFVPLASGTANPPRRSICLVGSDRAYSAAEPRASGRKKAAASVLRVTSIAFFDKTILPVRDRLERMRPD